MRAFGEHVIVAPVDDEANGWMSKVRRLYDPIAGAVPPHFTLVYPFSAEIDTEDLRLHMAQVLAGVREFPVVLDGVSGADGQYLRYDIKQGNDVLIGLHDRLYSGPLAGHLNIGESFQPHLTLGRIGDADRWRVVLSELARTVPRTTVTVRRVISYRRHADGSRHLDNSVSLS